MSKVSCGKRHVGSEYLNQKAQGEFCLVRVSVSNIGNESQMFDASNQKAFDSKGKEFSADGEAGIYLDDSQAFLNDINPGNKVKGIVVFDVPKGTRLETMEFHDSAFSGGVRVALR